MKWCCATGVLAGCSFDCQLKIHFLNHEHKITFLILISFSWVSLVYSLCTSATCSSFIFNKVLYLLIKKKYIYIYILMKKKTFIIPLVILLILSFFLRFLFWQMCTPSIWGKIAFIIPLVILLICLLFFRLLFLQMCTPSL